VNELWNKLSCEKKLTSFHCLSNTYREAFILSVEIGWMGAYPSLAEISCSFVTCSEEVEPVYLNDVLAFVTAGNLNL
jgi:hypothetical protein